MDPTQLSPLSLNERQAFLQRLELGIVVGGTLGVLGVMILRANGKAQAANLLSFWGVLGGGLLAALSVATGASRRFR